MYRAEVIIDVTIFFTHRTALNVTVFDLWADLSNRKQANGTMIIVSAKVTKYDILCA